MIERDRGLHGVATYNPDLLSKDELIASYVARQRLIERLLAELRREEGEVPQHRMLVGHRGMGKTTTLRRLRFAIDDDAELSGVWLPLVFPEEQYNVAALSDFWLNCVDSLADALEQRDLSGPLADLDDLVARVQTLPDEARRRTEALALLLDVADRAGRRLLLLVDNMDLVFQRLDTQAAWSLREVLSSQPAIMVLGAMTAAALDVSFQYDQPFHDFFRVHRLDPLDEPETFAVLRRLAEVWAAEPVTRLMEEDPGRIRALRVMTGGNPRTVVLLFQVLARGSEGGDVRSDLEQLLDQCTPLYKARFEALSPQAQRVVDAVAVHWDPVPAAQLAETLRLDTNHVSAQLDRLAKQGVVEKVGHYPGKRQAYSLAERFFNIWYLMRASRRVRRRLVWLVEFMRLLYAPQDLQRLARAELADARRPPAHRQRRAEYALALADAVDSGPLRYALETEGLRGLAADPGIRSRLAAVLDLDGDDRHLKDRSERLACLEEARELLEAANDATWSGGAGAEFWPLLGASVSLSPVQKLHTARRFGAYSAAQRDEFVGALVQESEEFRALMGSTWDEVGRAFAAGYMASLTDVDGARAAAVALDAPELLLIAIAAGGQVPNDLTEAELEAARARVDAPVLVLTATAEALQRGAAPAIWEPTLHALNEVATDELDSGAWSNLGRIYLELDRYEAAEAAYRSAIARDERNVSAWNSIGILLDRLGRYDEAAAAYREAIARDANNAVPWHNLGMLLIRLSRHEEAEAACRQAVAREAGAPTWKLLGLVLWRLGRCDEAEAAFREAIARGAEDAGAWHGLARGRLATGKVDAESVTAARHLLELAGDAPNYLRTAACILTAAGAWRDGGRDAARRFLVSGDEDYFEASWSDVETLFAEIARQGLAGEGRDLLDEVGLGERWRPMREAMAAVAAGSWRYLLTLAAEVREPTRVLLERFGVELEDPSPESS